MHSLHQELAGALAERTAKEPRYTLRGKKGIWRTSKHGHKIFIPDDGSGPMMNPKIKSAGGGHGEKKDNGYADSVRTAEAASKSAKSIEAHRAAAKAHDKAAMLAYHNSDKQLAHEHWNKAQQHNMEADDMERAAKPKEKPVEKKAGGDWRAKLKAAAHKAGETIVEPIHAVRNLIKKPEARAALKKRMVTAFKKEGAESKQMAKTIGRALKGEKITREERNQAINQAADVVKAGILAAGVAHVFSAGILKALAVIASPAEEIAGAALDGPLRAITKKVFGVAHGILPSAFYEAKSPDEVIEKLVDAILDELANAKSEASEQLAAAMVA